MLIRRVVAVMVACAALTGCSGEDEPAPPATFPSAEVSIVDGEVSETSPRGDDDAIAVIVDAEPQEALDEAVELLEGDGWELRGGSSASPVRVLRRDGEQVVVTSTPSGDGARVTYVVD